MKPAPPPAISPASTRPRQPDDAADRPTTRRAMAGHEPARIERIPPAARSTIVEPVAGWFGLESIQLAATWPQMFGPRADTRHYVARAAEDRVVAHAAARSVRLVLGDEVVTGELIGGVATAPDVRGQGHASALLAAIERDAAAFRVTALLLWSELHEFYRRLGYTPAGEQWEVTLPTDRARMDAIDRLRALAADGRTRVAQPDDLLAIFELHARNPVGVRRSLRDLEVQATTDPLTCLILERDGRCVAFACRDKGADLTGWWHDFGGMDADVAAILATALTTGTTPVTLLLPNYRLELLAALIDSSTLAHVHTGCCALVRYLGEPPSAAWRTDLFVDGLDSL